MRTKIAGITCLLVALSLGAWVYARAQHGQTAAGIESTPTERFQVVSAELDFTAIGGQLKQKTAIRIDTQTGQAWRLQEEIDKSGGRYFEWQAIAESK